MFTVQFVRDSHATYQSFVEFVLMWVASVVFASPVKPPKYTVLFITVSSCKTLLKVFKCYTKSFLEENVLFRVKKILS